MITYESLMFFKCWHVCLACLFGMFDVFDVFFNVWHVCLACLMFDVFFNVWHVCLACLFGMFGILFGTIEHTKLLHKVTFLAISHVSIINECLVTYQYQVVWISNIEYTNNLILVVNLLFLVD